MSRLNSPAGLLINRRRRISFCFEGKQFEGLAGDTLASALAANDQWLMSRSFKYHRPRGPLTMAGQDANTLVQLEGEPNVLADKIEIAKGLIATGQNCNGSLADDSDAFLGHFSRFMPVGFYYRSFYKMPFSKYKDSWKYWEPTIRRKAGLGELDLTFKPQYYDKEYLFYDVVVVGSGPAGLSAAITSAEAGARVLLVEEQPILGGSLTYHRFDQEGLVADVLRVRLLAEVAQNQRIKVFTKASCNGWFTDNYLPVIQGNRMFKVRAKECIVASGSFEQHVVFRNNDLPGIMMSSAAMRLMKHYAVKPGQSAVVLTGNDDGYFTALELDDQGTDVAAVIDMRENKDIHSNELKTILADRKIDLFTGHTVYEAMASKGNKKVIGVEVRAITGQGTVNNKGFKIACDLVCMSAGYMPVYQLLCQAGAQLSYDDVASEFSLNKLPAHLHIAGSVNATHALSAVLTDGKRAAIIALNNIGLALDQPVPNVECQRKVNFHWPIFSHPKGKDFVDFDEDLQAKDIVNATRLGYRDIQLVKRFSTVGMGPSQGRHSALPTARLVADSTDRNITQTGVTTARPPFSPEKLAHLAGRIFTPYRRTTMHRRHLALGAKMMPAGNWQRPAFYGHEKDRDQCMHRESVQVRTKVGIIDVSTLGGIELRGPDSAEFMNRIFCYTFLKQPVGKTRYAVLTNEQGVVIDDGVSCRISDEHFYVTATTSGVDNVYRDMMRWNTQWRLDVDITNVTSAFSAVNLAGPDARKVLELLVKDTDLSPEAFPYLAYREGQVVDIPARFLRVGFVGELAYEIHVPSRYGEALWDVLLEAGRAFDIRPFGIETQRLLRLEKGHIIVSQDTDSMSHPAELSLDWAVNRKKPFFVGRRSIDILQAQPQTRKLVGFKLAKDFNIDDKPKEGHLVLADNHLTSKITGNITSCEFSPTLDMIIGLAFVGIHQCAVGNTVYIKVDSGALILADVVKLPFYDPDNLRQQI